MTDAVESTLPGLLPPAPPPRPSADTSKFEEQPILAERVTRELARPRGNL